MVIQQSNRQRAKPDRPEPVVLLDKTDRFAPEGLAEELERVRRYVLDNPLKWGLDRENPLACTALGTERWMR